MSPDAPRTSDLEDMGREIIRKVCPELLRESWGESRGLEGLFALKEMPRG